MSSAVSPRTLAASIQFSTHLEKPNSSIITAYSKSLSSDPGDGRLASTPADGSCTDSSDICGLCFFVPGNVQSTQYLRRGARQSSSISGSLTRGAKTRKPVFHCSDQLIRTILLKSV